MQKYLFVAIIGIKNEVVFVAGKETSSSKTHHGEVEPMQQFLQTIVQTKRTKEKGGRCNRSPHDTVPEITCMMIKDPTMCQTITIPCPAMVVDFIFLFDVDVFC